VQLKLRRWMGAMTFIVGLCGFAVAYKLRVETKRAALYACLASIDAKLFAVTSPPPTLLKRLRTDESVVLTYSEAEELFQQLYGKLDCGCYDANQVPCDGPGDVILLRASSNAFGIRFEAFVQASDGKPLTAARIR
jgi:hypothetical protein